mmetsp:Transcript_19059/g.63845  ORF Transcript_19059/g.63845 Transcript_19059/m.63845 type:complete len:272 (+) Transcript_19059:213-1028(+)
MCPPRGSTSTRPRPGRSTCGPCSSGTSPRAPAPCACPPCAPRRWTSTHKGRPPRSCSPGGARPPQRARRWRSRSRTSAPCTPTPGAPRTSPCPSSSSRTTPPSTRPRCTTRTWCKGGLCPCARLHRMRPGSTGPGPCSSSPPRRPWAAGAASCAIGTARGGPRRRTRTRSSPGMPAGVRASARRGSPPPLRTWSPPRAFGRSTAPGSPPQGPGRAGSGWTWAGAATGPTSASRPARPRGGERPRARWVCPHGVRTSRRTSASSTRTSSGPR